jgi:hypothetical protein
MDINALMIALVSAPPFNTMKSADSTICGMSSKYL